MFEIPEPSGPPPPPRQHPKVLERIEPAFGLLRWSREDECWVGKLANTGADVYLLPEPATPDVFPKPWVEWLAFIDRDPVWMAEHRRVKTELRQLDRYGVGDAKAQFFRECCDFVCGACDQKQFIAECCFQYGQGFVLGLDAEPR